MAQIEIVAGADDAQRERLLTPGPLPPEAPIARSFRSAAGIGLPFE
jgi:hypothetical protein